MKTKYILLAALLSFGFNSATRAQHMGGDFMAGVQATLNNAFTEYQEDAEISRLWALLTNDIRFVMKAPETTDEGSGYKGPLWYNYTIEYGEGSIYGEYDWQNTALSMHVKQAKGHLEHNIGIAYFPYGISVPKKAIDHYQYMDQEGYWYIPSSPQANLGASHGYIKFQRQTAMMSLTRTMRGFAAVIERERNQIMARLAARGIINERLGTQLEDALNSFVSREQLSELNNMPLFVHWAVIYSPETVQQEGNFTATRFTYRGIPDCLMLSGARGKYMIFDNYNRLVFINSGPKGGSVEYFYDRDVTVNLPAASLVSVGSPFNRN